MPLRLRYVAVFVLLLVGAIFAPGLGAQSNVEDIVITEIDASEFPQVVLRFRALDPAGFPVTTLQTNMFSVREGSNQIAPENLTEVEEGLCIQFVVDAGVWLHSDSWDNAQAALTDFAQTTPWMKEDLDQVALTMVEAGGPRQMFNFTGDSAAMVTAVNNYTPPRGTELSRPVPVLAELVEEMEINPPEACENKPQFIVFLSSGMETGTDQVSTLASQAQGAGIPIYTVLLSNRPNVQQPLQTLAEQSGGQFVQYTNRNSLIPFYTQLAEYRRHFDLSYRSQVDTSGTQPVELVANVGGSGGTKSESGEYTVTVDPPRVLISAPTTNTEIVRSADAYTDDLDSLTPATTTVVASVIFPDNHLRRLREARLLVNGRPTQALTNPNPNEDLELLWNLQDIHEAGAFSLEVEVEDELGLVSKSPAVTANVDISVPPRPANSGPDIDVQATVAAEIAKIPDTIMQPTPIPCILPDSLCDPVERPIRRNPTSFVSLGVALFSLAFAGIVWLNRDKAPVRAVTDTVRRGVDAMTKKYLGPTEARAYLVVLEGDVNVGKTLEIYGDTPIGRSRQTAELIFQQYDDNSPISRLHCTITDEEDHFTIKDEDSANGTFLNGAKLSPLTPEELHDGDEIELGRVERGGVRLLFQLAQPGVDDSQVGRVTKKNRSSTKPSSDEDEPEQTTRKPEQRF